jgi:hypothetical protein
MRKDLGSVALQMVNEVDTGFRAAQEPTQRTLALKQRTRSPPAVDAAKLDATSLGTAAAPIVNRRRTR